MKILLYLLIFIVFANKLYAPARMHSNTIIYPTGHKYETKEKYEISRLKKEIFIILFSFPLNNSMSSST